MRRAVTRRFFCGIVVLSLLDQPALANADRKSLDTARQDGELQQPGQTAAGSSPWRPSWAESVTVLSSAAAGLVIGLGVMSVSAPVDVRVVIDVARAEQVQRFGATWHELEGPAILHYVDGWDAFLFGERAATRAVNLGAPLDPTDGAWRALGRAMHDGGLRFASESLREDSEGLAQRRRVRVSLPARAVHTLVPKIAELQVRGPGQSHLRILRWGTPFGIGGP